MSQLAVEGTGPPAWRGGGHKLLGHPSGLGEEGSSIREGTRELPPVTGSFKQGSALPRRLPQSLWLGHSTLTLTVHPRYAPLQQHQAQGDHCPGPGHLWASSLLPLERQTPSFPPCPPPPPFQVHGVQRHKTLC